MKALNSLQNAFDIPAFQEDASLAESTCKCVSSLCMNCPANQILFSGKETRIPKLVLFGRPCCNGLKSLNLL